MVAVHEVMGLEPGLTVSLMIVHEGRQHMLPARVTSVSPKTVSLHVLAPASSTSALTRHMPVLILRGDGRTDYARVLTRLAADATVRVLLEIVGATKMPTNERAHRRVNAAELFGYLSDLSDKKLDKIPVQLLDLSAGGARLRAPHAFNRGDAVRFQISLPPEAGGTADVQTRVAWVRPSEETWMLGIQFICPSRQATALIERTVFLLHWRKPGGGQ